MEEKYQVSVNVGKDVREFITNSNGSDVIEPEKESVLWSMIKPNLITSTQAAELTFDFNPESCIKIAIMRKTGIRKVYNYFDKKEIVTNTQYRYIISPEGQSMIRKHFQKVLKQAFHIYMTGYFSSREDAPISEAVTAFCLDCNIEVTDTVIERYRKDWFRFRLKDNIKNFCPLIF